MPVEPASPPPLHLAHPAYATRNPFGQLHALGSGAQHYRFEVDRECGVLLSVAAIRDEQPFHQSSALAIAFDEPIPAETFQFRALDGEEIRSTRAR